MHRKMPMSAGRINAANIHQRLPVSFLTVKRAVMQGQWNRVKVIKDMAVIPFQPFKVRISFKAESEE